MKSSELSVLLDFQWYLQSDLTKHKLCLRNVHIFFANQLISKDASSVPSPKGLGLRLLKREEISSGSL